MPHRRVVATLACVLALSLLAWLILARLSPGTEPRLLSAHRPVLMSSIWDSTHTGVNAVDGDTSTAWVSSSGPGSQWLSVDLGGLASIQRVKVRWGATYGSGYTIQTSEDATDWSTAVVAANGDGGIDDHSELSARGRYVRLHVTSGSSSDGFSVAEFEVFGTGPTAVASPVTSTGTMIWAGVRSSSYGIRGSARIPFPSPAQWAAAMQIMSGNSPARPAAIWLVGEVDFGGHGMVLEFPKPDDGRTYGPLYRFREIDRHEPYLEYFDAHGVEVFLQIEPGDADVATLIDLVLNRYGHHPSVVGLAIDAEWIKKTSLADTESPVTDAQAMAWERRVKAHGPGYRLVLKHFSKAKLPPTYRNDIVFVCDSERHGSYVAFLAGHKAFADWFYPNEVMFQFGYPSDRAWWSKLASPIPPTIGRDLTAQTRQDHGVLWVDFTINDPLIRLIAP